jgi:hypothetical protein
MDGLTQTTIQTDALLARFRAERSTKRSGADGARAYTSPNQVDHSTQSVDRVEISVNSTSATVNGVLNDSVVEQINRAIQESGIDLRIETDGSIDVSPEAAARRISDFATGFHDAYTQSRASEPAPVRLTGFMSLIRGAIEEGFSEARDFLSGIQKLSDTMRDTIGRTFELTQGYLSDFQAAKQAVVDEEIIETPVEEPKGGAEL